MIRALFHLLALLACLPILGPARLCCQLQLCRHAAPAAAAEEAPDAPACDCCGGRAGGRAGGGGGPPAPPAAACGGGGRPEPGPAPAEPAPQRCPCCCDQGPATAPPKSSDKPGGPPATPFLALLPAPGPTLPA